MNRIAIENLAGVTTLAKSEMAAVTGGLLLPWPKPKPWYCRFFPWLPQCRRKPFPFPLPLPVRRVA
jgi:hypothetical protein